MCRFLTDKGIDHLREYLNLPADVVPSTLKKSTRNLERGDRCGLELPLVSGLPYPTMLWHLAGDSILSSPVTSLEMVCAGELVAQLSDVDSVPFMACCIAKGRSGCTSQSWHHDLHGLQDMAQGEHLS